MIQGSKNITNVKDIKGENLESFSANEYISIPIKDLENKSPYEINKMVMKMLFPYLFKDNINLPDTKYKSKSFPHVAFFIEHMPHYTGGRYSIYHQAVLLSQYTNVTVVTNNKPPFYNDFKDYYNDRFNIVVSQDYLLHSNDNKFDLIIGVPMMSGIYAKDYAKKNELPLYLVLFESPNWISKYREGVDADEIFWSGYKKCLFEADKILVPSYESQIHLRAWDEKFKSKDIQVIKPCINELVANKVKSSKKKKDNNKKIKIIFTSRITNFKNPLKLIKGLPKDKYQWNIVGKVPEMFNTEFDRLCEENYDISIHNKLSDKEKFEIINDSDILVHPSLFEGYGMPPMEAIYFNKPVIVFDLPVLRETYGNSLNYVEFGNYSSFIQKIKEIARNTHENKREIDLYDDYIRNFIKIKRLADDLLRVIGIPKITAGIIVNNGEDYLEYAIKSIYHLLSQIIIVVGSVKDYGIKEYEKTYDIINKLKNKDYLNKIVFVGNNFVYNNKIEMQNEITKRVEGEYYLKLDHDEIWKPETLVKAIDYMIRNKLDILRMPFYHFWLSFKKIAKDNNGKWSTRHPRIWKWKNDFHHNKSFNYFVDKKNVKVSKPFYNEMEFISSNEDDKIFHFGYVRELNIMQNKIKYYKNRGIEKFAVDRVTNWKDGDKTQPTQNSNSWAEKFTGELPSIMLKHPYYKLKDIRDLNNKSINKKKGK